MLNIFKKKEKINPSLSLVKIIALLIHAAKIDENYTEIERGIIRKTASELSLANENIDDILKKAEEIEKNSNQILDFTREVKNMDEKNKIKIVETLWQIIYSNKQADMYETNLMRRLAGLLYIDNKTMGDIKEKIKNNS